MSAGDAEHCEAAKEPIRGDRWIVMRRSRSTDCGHRELLGVSTLSEQLDLTYPTILEYFGPHRAKGRAESRAFLAWFLEHYYHLDEQGSQDAVCDGPDDKGIDGIFVDDNLERVDVFQAKLYQNAEKTVGDRSLRDLAGTLDQLADADKVGYLAEFNRQ